MNLGGKSDGVRSLDQYRVAGPDRLQGKFRSRRRTRHMRHFNLLAKGFRQRRHLFADQNCIIDTGRCDVLGEAGVEGVGGLAKLAHRAQHGDSAARDLVRAEGLQGRRHRGWVGIVAFIDEQRLAAVQLDAVALPAPLETGHVGKRETGGGEVSAERLHRPEHGKGVRHPMLAMLADREGELRFGQDRRH
jgi:hypothetical protein